MPVDGEIHHDDEEVENESMLPVQLGKKILQVGHMQKRKVQQGQMEGL